MPWNENRAPRTQALRNNFGSPGDGPFPPANRRTCGAPPPTDASQTIDTPERASGHRHAGCALWQPEPADSGIEKRSPRRNRAAGVKAARAASPAISAPAPCGHPHLPEAARR